MKTLARPFTSSSAARLARLALLGAMTTLLALSARAQQGFHSHAPQLIVFEAPGATDKNVTLCDGYCGTQALAMNDKGTIVGFYTDDKVVPHAFIRSADGKYTSFEAPKAGIGAYLNQGTVPYSINERGEIVGQYEDASNVYYGFIRHPDGHFDVVDAPGADTTADSGHGTEILSNNDEGETAGIYVDAKGVEHSFFRTKEGVVTEIVPDKGAPYTGICEETCLNDAGTSVGSYFDSSFIERGFLRTRDGKITTFSAPGAGTSEYTGTQVASISPEGDIAGYLVDNKGIVHSFVRHCDGTFSDDFEVPGADLAAGDGAAAFAINAFGATTGIYVDSSSVLHGFERSASGMVLAEFTAPKSVAGTGPGQGTRPSVNNIKGEVAGWTIDATGLLHGFLWIP